METEISTDLSFGLIALVLATAFMHASWNAMVRGSADKLSSLALMTGASALITIPALPFLGFPSIETWGVLLATAVLHVGYKLFLVRAYTYGDLGHVYPIARGSAPLLVTIGAFLFIGETLSIWAIGGLFLVTGGIMSLTLGKRGGTADESKATLYALITATFIASYTMVDGIGGRIADSPFQYVFWLTLIDGGVFFAIGLYRRGWSSIKNTSSVWTISFGGAALQLMAYTIVIWAMSVAPLGPVSALRETSVIFAAFLSSFMLKEPIGRLGIAAAITVALGVALIKF
jgi:drug/metabolite transporter (DMT)-like permease